MPDGADDRDALIKDLIDESFGLRTKAEQLSQYVESKVAELVKTQMELEALEDGSISIYEQDGFVDLCRGPHVENVREIRADAFKLHTIAGAYWKGEIGRAHV